MNESIVPHGRTALPSPGSSPDPIFCTYEDRPSALIGLKLMTVSLLKYRPAARIICHCPRPPECFKNWAKKHTTLSIDQNPLPEAGWAVKPHILLQHLRENEGPVVWIDSDIIFTRGADVLDIPLSDRIVICEEAPGRESEQIDRTTPWGLKVGRTLPRHVNTCIVGVNRSHRPLLQSWAELLADGRYRNAQTQPFFDRPKHVGSDQDVLGALLNSDMFSEIPVSFIRADIDIAQCWFVGGFSAVGRLRALFKGLPPMVHAQGIKPWETSENRLERWASELNPYNTVAKKFASVFPDELSWTRPASRQARLLDALALGNPAARGLFLMALVRCYQLLKPPGGRR